MRVFVFLLLLGCCLAVKAQKKDHFNVTFAGGPLYIFNDATLDRLIGFSGHLGMNYQFCSKNEGMIFIPALGMQKQVYRAKASETEIVEIDQDMFACHLDVLMRIQKRWYLRVGLFFQYMLFSSVNIINKNSYGQNYYSYGNETLEINYQESQFQSGFCLGFSFPFKLFKNKQSFNVSYKQIASSVVDSDYTLQGSNGSSTHVLSLKARPSIFTLGFDISLQKNKKKASEDD